MGIRVKLAWPAIAAAAIAAAWVGGRCSRGDELGTWKKAAREALTANAALRRQGDSLEVVQRTHEAQASQARARVDTLWRLRDSVRTIHDTAAQLGIDEALVASCRVALVEDSLGLSACDRRAAIERLRGDSLEHVVEAGLTVNAGRRCGLFAGVGVTGSLRASTAGLTLGVGCRIL